MTRISTMMPMAIEMMQKLPIAVRTCKNPQNLDHHASHVQDGRNGSHTETGEHANADKTMIKRHTDSERTFWKWPTLFVESTK
jgi:hypothetical protein